MSKSAFIVVEQKCGRGTPSRVWEASSEQDYMTRVAASNPRSDNTFATFQEAIDGECERHAMSVKIMNQEEFNAFAPEDHDPRVLRIAHRLDWYEPESEAE